MISLTRLTGQRFALNPDLIERVEATPDTVISMVDGAKHVVIETVEDVVDAVCHFRACVLALSQRMEVGPTPTHDGDGGVTPLRLVARNGGDS